MERVRESRVRVCKMRENGRGEKDWGKWIEIHKGGISMYLGP